MFNIARNSHTKKRHHLHGKKRSKIIWGSSFNSFHDIYINTFVDDRLFVMYLAHRRVKGLPMRDHSMRVKRTLDKEMHDFLVKHKSRKL